jgi:hypothetical protein
MQGGQAASTRPRLPLRLKVGLGVTGLSLFLLIFPGQMALPLTALTPLMPRMGGCANFGAPIVFVAFFGVAILLSAALIGLGIASIVLTALRVRIGLLGAIVINASVMSLLLISPLDFSLGTDPGAMSLYVFLSACAVVPATALALLLSPATFASWWRAPRAFLVTAIVVAVLLVPGAIGLVSLGLQAGGISSVPPAAATPVTPHSGCGGA